MKLSILHPSRSRSQQALSTAVHWLQNMSRAIDYSYTISIDSSDPELKTYLDLFDHKLVSDNKNIVEAVNIAARFAINGNPDIFIVISDDFQCFKNWDLAIVDALSGKSGVLKTFDGIQRWIVTLPVMTRDYYEQQGYLYDPLCAHMFCDTIMTHKADIERNLVIRNDIVFRHNHYSIGGCQKDALNERNDKTINEGKEIYLNWVRQQTKQLSRKQSESHRNWLIQNK